MERTNRLLWQLVIAVTLFFLVVKGLAIWAEGLWFASEGYALVFVRRLLFQVAMFALGFSVFFLAVYTPYWFAKKGAEKVPMPLREKLFGDLDKLTVDVTLDKWALIVCLFLAAIAGLIASNRWIYLLHFLYSTPFGQTDPIFKHNIGFYVFKLPFIRFWVTFTLVGLTLGLIAMVLRL